MTEPFVLTEPTPGGNSLPVRRDSFLAFNSVDGVKVSVFACSVFLVPGAFDEIALQGICTCEQGVLWDRGGRVGRRGGNGESGGGEESEEGG